MTLRLRDGRLGRPRRVCTTPPLARALALLNGDGEEARLVGGAVRDLLLGLPPGDFDLATTATPEVVMARAQGGGDRLRADRHRAWHRDADRRRPADRDDDPAPGHRDRRAARQGALRPRLRRRRAPARLHHQRAVARRRRACARLRRRPRRSRGGARALHRRRRASASARIILRILRFLRFSARFGDGRARRRGLRRRDRRAGGAGDAFGRAGARGTAENPGRATRRRGDRRGRQRRAARAAVRRRCCIRRDSPAWRRSRPRAAARPIRDCGWRRSRWRCAKMRSDCASGCGSPTPKATAWTPPRAPRSFARPGERRRRSGTCASLLFERGRHGAPDALTLAHAECGAAPDDPRWLSAYRFLRDTPTPRLPFTGADLVARGVAPGRGVGEALKALQAKWISAGFPREPETLARLLDEALQET